MPSYESKLDPAIYKHAARCMYFRAVDMTTLTGRTLRVIQRRLKKLCDRGLMTWVPSPFNSDQRIYYLTQAGWDHARAIGATDYKVRVNAEKKPGLLPHDLRLTQLYILFYLAFGDRIERWSQLYFSRKYRWGKGPDDYVNTDAVTAIRLDEGYVIVPIEIENQKGVKEPMKKMRGYVRLIDSGAFQKKFGDYPCLVVMVKENDQRIANVLAEAHADKRTNVRMFLLSTYAAAATFRTPVDYETRTWGFQDFGALVS